MKTFIKKVDLRSRKAMIRYLSEHFRYHTMNSWNNSTSYAHNMKVYNCGLDSEVVDNLYELMETQQFYDELNRLIEYFDREHNYCRAVEEEYTVTQTRKVMQEAAA